MQKIAAEKAGIFKAGSRAFTVTQQPSAMQVLEVSSLFDTWLLIMFHSALLQQAIFEQSVQLRIKSIVLNSRLLVDVLGSACTA